jgi:hypothetical protein
LITYNLAADGSTPEFSSSKNELVIVIEGDFGSGTAAIQIEGTSTNFVTLADGTGTSDFAKRVFAPGNAQLRVNLSGATSPDLNVTVYPVTQ